MNPLEIPSALSGLEEGKIMRCSRPLSLGSGGFFRKNLVNGGLEKFDPRFYP